MTLVARILIYLRPYWPLAAASGALILLAAGTSLLVPWPLKILIDHVLSGQPLPSWLQTLIPVPEGDRASWLLVAVVAGLVVALVANTVTVLSNYVNTKIDQGMVLDFRSDLFRHAQRLSLAFHDQQRSGGLMYADQQPGATVGAVPMMVAAAGAERAHPGRHVLHRCYSIDRTLALLALTVVPFSDYAVALLRRHIQPRLSAGAADGGRVAVDHPRGDLDAARDRRVRPGGHEYRRFAQQGEERGRARVRLTVRQTLFSLVVNADHGRRHGARPRLRGASRCSRGS